MSANKFFPKLVKNILPFAPVVGVVSTCLLVASAVAQVAEPIMNAGWGLQVSYLISVVISTHNVHVSKYTQTLNLFQLQRSITHTIDPCPPPPPYWRSRWLLASQGHWFWRGQVPYHGY